MVSEERFMWMWYLVMVWILPRCRDPVLSFRAFESLNPFSLFKFDAPAGRKISFVFIFKHLAWSRKKDFTEWNNPESRNLSLVYTISDQFDQIWFYFKVTPNLWTLHMLSINLNSYRCWLDSDRSCCGSARTCCFLLPHLLLLVLKHQTGTLQDSLWPRMPPPSWDTDGTVQSSSDEQELVSIKDVLL